LVGVGLEESVVGAQALIDGHSMIIKMNMSEYKLAVILDGISTLLFLL
jgi:hypothetical protein